MTKIDIEATLNRICPYCKANIGEQCFHINKKSGEKIHSWQWHSGRIILENEKGVRTMDLNKFVREINECYGVPFLPNGFVKAKVTESGTLWLDIGDRNGEFDRNGEMVGAGTNVGEWVDWNITHKEK